MLSASNGTAQITRQQRRYIERQVAKQERRAAASPPPLEPLQDGQAEVSPRQRRLFIRLARRIKDTPQLLQILATLDSDEARDRFLAQVRPFLTFEPNF